LLNQTHGLAALEILNGSINVRLAELIMNPENMIKQIPSRCSKQGYRLERLSFKYLRLAIFAPGHHESVFEQ
jgi:hypothetical protein